MKTVTHYQRLGIARNAPAEVIRGAYKALAQTNHPDKNLDNPVAHEVMQEINQAYAVLSDPHQRAEYDAWLDGQEEMERAAWTQPPPPPPPGAQQIWQSPQGDKIKLAVFFVAVTGAMIFSFGYYAFFAGRVPPPPPSAAAQPVNPAAPPPAPQTRPAAPANTAAPQSSADAEKTLATCVFSAAKIYTVSPAVLLSFLITEHGAVGRESLMADKSSDLGPMQINSWWLPQLAKLWNVKEDKAREMLRDNACVNVGVSAWILQSVMKKGGSLSAIITRYDFAAHHLVTHPVDGSSSYVVDAMKRAEGFKDVRSPADLLGGKAIK